MILTCPECSARYLVDPQALLPKGRTVRCAKCRHIWKEAAPDSALSTETKNIPETKAPSADTDNTGDGEDKFAVRRAQRQKRLRPLPKGSNLPALQDHKYGGSLWGWYSLGAFVVIMVSSFLIFQNSISHWWPPSQKLYRALGMESNISGSPAPVAPPKQPEILAQALFEIKDTIPTKVIINGVVTLKVEGNIINITNKTQPLPLLRISLKDKQGKVIRKWTFKPSAATISPKGKAAFSTSLPHPPGNATSISVTFAADSRR